ncbi:MAG: histidine kinase, partial [Bacteroidales bacterium]
SRFDGLNFTNFTEKEGIPNQFVYQFIEDSYGNILMLTKNGIAIFDGSSITGYPTDLLNYEMLSLSFYERSKDSIYITFSNLKNQLIEVLFSKGKYQQIHTLFPENNTKFPDNQFFSAFDKTTKIHWVASNHFGLNKINGTENILIQDNFKIIHGFVKGSDGQLYLMADNSFYELRQNELIELANKIETFDLATTNQIAISKDGSIYFLNQKSGKLNILQQGELFQEEFNLGMIDIIYIDDQDIVWIGTENGLFRLSNKAFLNFIPEKGGLNNNVWSVVEDKNGRMMFASLNDGLQYLKEGKFYQEKDYLRLTGKENLHFYMGSLRDYEGNVYFSITKKIGLKYNGIRFKQIFPDTDYFTALIMYQAPDTKEIMAGTNNGLYMLTPENSKIKHWQIKPGGGKNHSIVGIVKDKMDRYWLGGFNGISILNNNDNIAHLPTVEVPFEGGGNCLFRDRNDNLWIGNSKGLFMYDYSTFRQIIDPSINAMVVAITQSGDSTLIIATLKGLLTLNLNSFYDKNQTEIINIGPDKGFEAIEPGQNGFFLDSKGYYWLPATDRVLRFDPRLLKKNKYAPDVHILGVALLNQRMKWESVSLNDSIDPVFYFAKNEKNLRFDFLGISLHYPEGVTYSHYLEGYDQDWSEPDKERSAVYTNLPPGKYGFHVKAANADGIWSTEPISLDFRIVPAIYQKLWFRIIILVIFTFLCGFLGAIIYNYRRQKQRARLENENEMAYLKLLTIKNQIDPHFTYNAINTLASVVLKEDKENAYKFFLKFSQMLRQIMNSSDKLTRRLKEEIDFVKDFLDFQMFRFKDRFTYSLVIQEDINLGMYIPKMVIQTFAENALKHGILHLEGKGELKINITKDNEFLIITVVDNGIGRAKALEISKHTTGKGILIIKGIFDFYDRLNRNKILWEIIDLYDHEENAAGTKVYVKIPEGYLFA